MKNTETKLQGAVAVGSSDLLGSRWKNFMDCPGNPNPGKWESGTLIEINGDWFKIAADSGGFISGPSENFVRLPNAEMNPQT